MLLSQLRHPKPIHRAALTWLANAEGGYSTSRGHPAAHNRPYGRKLHGARP